MKLTGFVDPTKLTNQIVLWLRINNLFALVGSLIWLLLFILSFYMDANPSAGGGRHEILTTVRISIGIFFILLLTALLITFVYFMHWVHLISNNVRQMGVRVEGMKFTPAAAVCWFFVPIANLFMVPKVMNELWKTSKNPRAWQSEPDDLLLLRWFWFFVISYACSSFANGLYKDGMTSEQLILPTVLQLVAGIIAIVSALALISVVKQITAMQLSHVANVRS